MNKPKSITQLSKEQLEDLCLNLMHTDKVKTKMINQLETNRDEAIELLTKGFNFCENDSQGEIDICNIAINREKKAIEILRRGKE